MRAWASPGPGLSCDTLLVDPALAAAALGAGPQRLRADLNTLGTLFESAVVHDLTVFASRIDGEVSHYRDSNHTEIDAVIALPDGHGGVVAVKLVGQQLTAGVASLNAVIAQIDTAASGEPRSDSWAAEPGRF